MKSYQHTSATSTHYDKEAEHYDAFNEQQSQQINTLLQEILTHHTIKTIVDLSCGTGSQVFWLSKCGFDIKGFDISPRMIEIAQQKAHEKNSNVELALGDMRTTRIKPCDAAITIFNAIGHLTKTDFQKTLKNIYHNLKPQGLYIFDIFNLSYLLHKDNITKLTIDWLKKYDSGYAREIQYSTINTEGILASYDIYHEQKSTNPPTISTAFQTLQVYSKEQLQLMLSQAGFTLHSALDISGKPFDEINSDRMLIIAQKQP